MEAFRRMTNECISVGLYNDVSSLKRLSNLSYGKLASYGVPSYYKVCAISRAAGREDVQHKRQLWCGKCQRWSDRDVVAVMNQSLSGWVRFAHSKGEAVEAMRGNQTMPVILRVDASKGCLR
jgi:hypothetical protein